MTASRPLPHTIAMALAILYGCTSLSLGIVGYVKAGSVVSLLAGGGCGILLLICAALVLVRPIWGFIGAAVISIALLAVFVRTVVQAQSGQPMSEMKQITATIMTAGGVIVLLACTLALSKPSGCCGK